MFSLLLDFTNMLLGLRYADGCGICVHRPGNRIGYGWHHPNLEHKSMWELIVEGVVASGLMMGMTLMFR